MENEIIDNQHKNKLAVANAEVSTESVPNSALTIKAFNNGNTDIATLVEKLHKQVEKAATGDASRSGLMLMTQAQTLDVIFHSMMRKSMASEYMSQLQAYAELGLKAQNQCRKVLLALAEIKTPKRATFIKQQNNAINQQVNNSIKSKNQKKTKKVTNELLSEAKYEALDDRRKATTSTINPPVETVESRRGKNTRRKKNK